MKKILIEINQLDHDPTMGGTKIMEVSDFPAPGIYQWSNNLFFVQGGYVFTHILDDPHWLELFCMTEKQEYSLQSSVSESFVLKLLAVAQNPALAESLAFEK